MAHWSRGRLRHAAARILAAGLEAADPTKLVERSLQLSGHTLSAAGQQFRLGRGRLVVVAAGKAAATMAYAAETVLGGRIDASLAVDVAQPQTPGRTRVLLAGHPVPDRRGLAAAAEIETLARSLGREDLLLLLLSGGASALLPAPAPGIRLADKAALTARLLRSGARIDEINAVRKHLSRLKGGGLARAAAPAAVVSLVLSDVVGDDPATIASGPTAPDPTSYADAVEVLRRRGLLDRAPARIMRHLLAGARGEREETPKPGDRLFRQVATRVVGSNRLSVEAAASQARRLGLRPLVLTTRLEGEAREVGRVLAGILMECVARGRPARPPLCLLAGGETTVTVRGSGRGGRNQELVVAAGEALAGLQVPAVVASLATDGIDGGSEAGGGVVDELTRSRGESLGLAPAGAFLAANDSQGYLAPLGDLIITGPTGTNVADLTVALAGERLAGQGAR